MKGLKLTPFLLFIILLVVLIVAMLFGASVSNIVEGHTSSLWEEVRAEKIESVDGDVVKIHETKDGLTMYYVISNGNVVIPTANDTLRTLPREMTSDNEVVVGSNVSNVNELAPWTFVETSSNMSIMYCPIEKKSAFIVVMDNSSNEIVSVFTHAEGVSSKYADTPVAIVPALAKINNESEYITQGKENKVQIEGVKSKMITKDLYYSHSKGITILKNVAEKEYSSSTDFAKGLSLQYNENMLAVSSLVEEKIRTCVIVRKENGHKMVASYSMGPSFMGEEEEVEEKEEEEVAVQEKEEVPTTLPPIRVVVESKTKDAVSAAPQDVISSSPASCEKDSNFILKSEIVPPVCPGCPPCSVVSPSTCNLSVNASGEIVDCNGKKIENDTLLTSTTDNTSSSPGSWSKGLGDNVENIATTGITTAGNTVDKTLDTAGGAFDKTLDTATGAFDKTLDTATGAFDKTIDTASNAVGNVASGAVDVVTGVSSDIAGLGNNVIDTTGDILQASRPLTLNQQQQQQPMYAQTYGQPTATTYPMYYGPMQQGQANPMVPPGYGYSYPQQCPQRGSSDFMPITNDFSQFS